MSDFVLNVQDTVDHLQDFIDHNPRAVTCLRWPTASGKTSVSIALADQMNKSGKTVHIISADSRQVYREMDIATDKISIDIRDRIIHHQIDIVDPDQIYSAGQRKQDVDQLIRNIHQMGHHPVIVWWTGLYIDTIYYNFSLPHIQADWDYRKQLQDLESEHPGILHQMLVQVDPIDANLHHPHSTRFIIRSLEIYHHTGQPKSKLFFRQEIPYPLMMAGIMPPASYSNTLIDHRVDQMFDQGLIAEVQWLVESWYNRQHVAMNGIWYIEVLNYLDGMTDLSECIRLIKQHTHQYAKRQRTWMRKYVRDSQTDPHPGVEYLIIQ